MQGFKWLLDSVYMYFVSAPLMIIAPVFAVLIAVSAALVMRALDREESLRNDK
ncbi:MAG: hypothetical protein IKR93_04435 [Firmicutes bacterium]|nr:hypothetical protein [Bacillota bacterium]